MSGVVRQPVCYPVSAVFVDDNADFLRALRGIFPDGRLHRFFTEPRAALDFLASCGQRDVPLRLAGAEYAEVEKNGGGVLGPDPLRAPRRFEEIAAVVVDDGMPGLDGLELLAALPGFACTRVLLAGAATEQDAIDAFNHGLIDFYLQKSDPDMSGRLNGVLADARRRHCAERGFVSVHEVGATYCDPRVLHALAQVAEREQIVEYYWRPEQDAVLTFDAAGEAGVFVAWSESDWSFQCAVVADEGGPHELRAQMETRRVMPLFWPHQAWRPGSTDVRSTGAAPVPGWPGAFYGWARLEVGECGADWPTFAKWRPAATN